MLRTFLITLLFSGITSVAFGQTYGVFVGGLYSDMHGSGHTYQPGFGPRVGAFMPFFVHDRIIVRAEAGFSAQSGKTVDQENGSTRWNGSSIDVAVLGRYFVNRKTAISAGPQLISALSGRNSFIIHKDEVQPSRSDVVLLVGAARRVGDRLELGVRYGQGLRKAADLGSFAKARYRYGTVMLSYLVSSKHTSFVEKRRWRDPLQLDSRY